MSGYVASLVSVIGINMILALGLNIITGFCGQVSLGHAAFYGKNQCSSNVGGKKQTVAGDRDRLRRQSGSQGTTPVVEVGIVPERGP